MSREIKFRFRYTNSINYIFQVFTMAQICNGEPFEVLNDNPMLKLYCHEGEDQFTGLKDKNGVDIYEGDIVKQEKWVSVGEYVPTIGIVKYSGVEFTCDCIGEWEGSNADLNGNATVIGNIYSTPELLTPKP